MKLLYYWVLVILVTLPTRLCANEVEYPLIKAQINLSDKASLQRGANLFMNYCLGCHSLKYLRYNTLAEDIGLTDAKGKVVAKLVKENLIFTGEPINSSIRSSLASKDAVEWFGIAPPDLSLRAKIRGVDWLNTFLRGFYQDPKRPWGVNNIILPNVAMPNVLVNLQGVQKAVYRHGSEAASDTISNLVLTHPGKMDPLQFDKAVNDIVNFLAFVAEPTQVERKHLGIWVMLFMMAFAVLTYFLKKEYWKDIK